MKRRSRLLFPAMATSLALLLSCKDETLKVNQTEPRSTESTKESAIDRGKYLVGIMGCNDCHSPKQMGEKGPEIIPELMLSGYPSERPIVKFASKKVKEGFATFYPDLTAAAGPWGVSFASNLTPDETGLGLWTEEQFTNAITHGKYKGMDNGRTLLPPMPWNNYQEMKTEDIHALFSYLRTIKPVKNIVPPPIKPEDM